MISKFHTIGTSTNLLNEQNTHHSDLGKARTEGPAGRETPAPGALGKALKDCHPLSVGQGGAWSGHCGF